MGETNNFPGLKNETETETFTRPDILSLGGTETGTETTKVSVPRVSAPRPPISDPDSYQGKLYTLGGVQSKTVDQYDVESDTWANFFPSIK